MSELRSDQNRDTEKAVAYVSKDKYKALEAEIRQWEDDFWHPKRFLEGGENKTDTSTEKTKESLANLTHEHVSSLRKFWEGLMTQDNLNEAPKRPPLRPIQVPSVFSGNGEKSEPQPANANDRHSSSHLPVTETADLPPPPAIVEQKAPDAVELSSSDLPAELPLPPPDVEMDVAEEDVRSKSADFIDASESPNGQYFLPELPSTAQPKFFHCYYKRPRLGASALNCTSTNAGAPFRRGVLRNWPNSVSLNKSSPKTAIISSQSASTLPRQRSVTFEPYPGSAPGDTEGEELETDEIVQSYSHTSLPVDQEREYNEINGESIGILESAARLANSAERYDRASRRRSQDSRRSSVVDAEGDVLCPADDDSLVEDSDEPHYSNDESVPGDDDESVNSEPVVGPTSVSVRGSKTSLIASPLKGRKSGDSGSRRISREASALLDFDLAEGPSVEADAICDSDDDPFTVGVTVSELPELSEEVVVSSSHNATAMYIDTARMTVSCFISLLFILL
ncbi:hypothetical protein Aperf_G00000114666 [Anoplocephala perfoliata]